MYAILPLEGWWYYCIKCYRPTYNINKKCNTCIYNSKKKKLLSL